MKYMKSVAMILSLAVGLSACSQYRQFNRTEGDSKADTINRIMTEKARRAEVTVFLRDGGAYRVTGLVAEADSTTLTLTEHRGKLACATSDVGMIRTRQSAERSQVGAVVGGLVGGLISGGLLLTGDNGELQDLGKLFGALIVWIPASIAAGALAGYLIADQASVTRDFVLEPGKGFSGLQDYPD